MQRAHWLAAALAAVALPASPVGAATIDDLVQQMSQANLEAHVALAALERWTPSGQQAARD